MKKNKKQNLTREPQIRTVNQIMADLEAEIAAIKSGELTEVKARLVARHRALQLKTVDQYLGAARLAARFGVGGAQTYGLLADKLGLPAPKAAPTVQ